MALMAPRDYPPVKHSPAGGRGRPEYFRQAREVVFGTDADGNVIIVIDGNTITLGIPGPRGPRGAEGTPGAWGDEGQEGEMGPPGPVGSAGATGLPGPPGIDGLEGSEGPIGPIGPPGTQGLAGREGIPGSPGFEGEEGQMGFPGPPGSAGPQGTAGLPGSPGIDGQDGPEGSLGPPGAQGIQGVQGIPGAVAPSWSLDGIDGTDGEQGIPGPSDHGLLSGLADDDHPQYRLESENHSHQSSGLQGGTLDVAAIATGVLSTARGGTGIDAGSAWSTWSPTFGGFSTSPVVFANYVQIGKITIAVVITDTEGTSNAATFTVTLPAAAKRTGVIGIASLIVDNGAEDANPGQVRLTAGSTTATISRASGAAWTASGLKYANFAIVYEAN